MYLLGIDTSTTATKAILVDERGAVVATAASEYPFATPQPGWTEQEPELFWQGTVSSIRLVLEQAGITGAQVAAVGITGQMHGMTMLDSQGQVIRPCILWNDQRTAGQCAAATAQVGAERLIALTGNPMLTGFTAPKILWVRDNEPEAYARAAHVLLPKDYVRYRLTGALCSDVSDASGTGLFDVRNRRWSAELLAELGIPRSWLPEVSESPVVSAHVSAAGAAATGLLAGTPVVAGAGDQAAQAVGAGIVREGIVSVTIGTSGVVFAHADSYRVEPTGRLHAFCHAVPGAWHMMGVMLSAGGSLRWYRDTLAAGQSYDQLMGQAASVQAGSEGLVFLPYLTGERAPHPDPSARGAFVGLSVRHTQAHLTRAVVEGVSLGLNDSLALMRELGVPTAQVRASGGGARSPFWRQMLADLFGAEIVTLAAEEGAAYGAALLAGVGVGQYASVEAAVDATVQLAGSCAPGPDAATYTKLVPLYQALYPALREQFAKLADFAQATG
jgi:xylulokinase